MTFRKGLFLFVFIFLLIGTLVGFDIAKDKVKSYLIQPQAQSQVPIQVSQNVQAVAALSPPVFHIHYKDKVAVITYHNIDPTESPYTISPERFHLEMQALKDNGYNVISVEDFTAFLQNKKAIPPNAVVITFDDGYKSVYDYAYPELKKFGFTATTFLIVHNQDAFNPALPFLSWDQIKEMHQNGFSFYSHTYYLHDPVPGLNGKPVQPLISRVLSKNRLETESEYEKKVKQDLILADDSINKQLGNKINLLCFPHGDYTKTVLEIGEKVGIHYFFTGMEGINTHTTKVLIKRINIGSPYINADDLIKKLNYFENH